MTSAFPVQNRFQMAPLLDLKSKTAPLPNISVFDSYGSYCYNLCSLSCISCMLKFVYVLMGHMAYCMNKLLTLKSRPTVFAKGVNNTSHVTCIP